MTQNCCDLALVDAQVNTVDGFDFWSPTMPETLLETHDPDGFFILEFPGKNVLEWLTNAFCTSDIVWRQVKLFANYPYDEDTVGLT